MANTAVTTQAEFDAALAEIKEAWEGIDQQDTNKQYRIAEALEQLHMRCYTQPLRTQASDEMSRFDIRCSEINAPGPLGW